LLRRKQGHEFIGMNVGTLLVLYDTFFALLAHNSFAPDIGQPQAQALFFPRLMHKIRFAHGVVRAPLPEWFVDMPNDPRRRVYAMALTFCALDFILQHELAHLEMGHLEYLQGTASTAAMFERRIHDDAVWSEK
jgi:hypothetical protein